MFVRDHHRQVLYQTVADPQQRIAKLTMKDPRRTRRFSDSGLPLKTRSRFAVDKTDDEFRRTTYPGTPLPHDFEHKPSSLGLVADSSQVGLEDEGGAAWGSPIVAREDEAIEGAIAGVTTATAGADEARPWAGPQVSSSTQSKPDTRDSGDGSGSAVDVSEPACVDGEEILYSPDDSKHAFQEDDDYEEPQREDAEEEEPVKRCSESEGEEEAERGEEDSSVAGPFSMRSHTDRVDHRPIPGTDLSLSGDDRTALVPFADDCTDCDYQASSDPVDSAADTNDERLDPYYDRPERARLTPQDDRVDISWDRTSASDEVKGEGGGHVGGSVSTAKASVEASADAILAHTEHTANHGDVPSGTIPAGTDDKSVNAHSAESLSVDVEGRGNLTETAGRGDGTVASSGAPPSRRVSWEREGVEGRRDQDEIGDGMTPPKPQSRLAAQMGRYLGRGGHSTGCRAENVNDGGGGGRVEPVHLTDSEPVADVSTEFRPPLPEHRLTSSLQFGSGIGAAALAASGVFDMSGTSGEAGGDDTGGDVSVGDLDSLDGDGQGIAQVREEEAWAPQQPQVEGEPNDRRPLRRNDATEARQEDERSLVKDLMQQVSVLKCRSLCHCSFVKPTNCSRSR